jgi:hypothetical protein
VNLEALASSHNVVTRRDSCGESLIILGRPPRPRPEDCCHIYDHGNGRFGLVLLFDRELLWNNAKKRLTRLGFEVSQDGETEGVLLFDPKNAEHVRLAFKAARVQKVHTYSEEARAQASANARKQLPLMLAVKRETECGK